MEFKSFKNIETGFRQIRFFGIAYLFVCASLVGFSLWKAYSFAEAQRQKIYVLDEGKSLMLALSQDLEQNRPVEAREHVKRFHELFFTLAPDKSAIEGNIQRAMFLSDRSAYEHYSDLAEQGYYNRIISGNVSQRIEVDSISCNFNHYPYEVVTYARLSIIRLITADHETGGVTVAEGHYGKKKVVVKFNTGWHTASPVPFFAYGPGAELFSGFKDNTASFYLMKDLLKLK